MVDTRKMSKATMKVFRRELWILSAFSCAIGMLFLTGPLYMMQVYDRVLNSQSISTLTGLTLLIVVLYIAMGILDWARNSLFSTIASKVEEDLSDPVLDAVLDDGLKSSSTSPALSYLQTVRRFLSSPVMSAIFDAPWSLIFLYVLFLLHWTYGLTALIGGTILVLISILNQILMSKPLSEADEQGRLAQSHALETHNEIATIQALGMRGIRSELWRKRLDDADRTMLKASGLLGIFSASAKTFRMMLQSGILGLGAWLVIEGYSTPGTMIAASIMMGRVIAPVEQLTSQWRSASGAIFAWKALNEIIADRNENASEQMSLPPIEGKLSFENIFVGPANMEKPVLKNISFQMEVGDCLAVIGASASGKSTLAKTITGIMKPTSGVVRIDNADRSHFDVDVLGKQIGYLPQSVGLISGNIRENISRFEPQVSDESVIEAAKAAACHDFILQLPNGYDTQIGPGGAYLSGGQKQRVGLARALFGRPKLIVLDEPNSNLDSQGEKALQSVIQRLKADKVSVVLIVHRQSSLKHCNKLMVLTDGRIQLFGPKDEVLSKLQTGTAS